MAAEINWRWLRRSVMPQCRGGMLMLFQLLISALWRHTLILVFLLFTCLIPKNSHLVCFNMQCFFFLSWIKLYKCENAFQSCIKNLLIEKKAFRDL